MTEWEEKLSPRAKERLARIGEASPEEKKRMKDFEELNSMLSKFYKGQLDPEGLWRELKGYKDQGKGYLLREAQMKLIDSLILESTPAEFQKRKDGILALESLKKEQNISVIEPSLNKIGRLQEEYKEGKERVANELKAEVERNPQLRMQPVKTQDGRTIMQATLSVDEAVKARLADFLSEHEKRYSQEFIRTVERLKKEVR